MIIFMQGYEWAQQCVLAYVVYDGGCDELSYCSRCEWIVPGTIGECK